MERRVLLAIFLAFIVLYTWQALFVKPVPKAAPRRHGATSSAPSRQRQARLRRRCRTVECLVGRRRDGAARAATSRRRCRRRDRGARRARRNARRHRGVHEPRRAAQELAPEAFSRFKRSSRRSSSSRICRRSRCPSRCARRTTRTTATLNGALYTVSGAPTAPATSAPVDLRFEYRDSAGLHAVEGVPPRAVVYICRVPRRR